MTGFFTRHILWDEYGFINLSFDITYNFITKDAISQNYLVTYTVTLQQVYKFILEKTPHKFIISTLLFED